MTDAKQHNIIVETTAPTTQLPLSDSFKLTPYEQHKDQFDDLLVAVTDYFELFKKNTDKLEDLFLQLLETLKLDTPTAITNFDALHHFHFSEIVVKNVYINVRTFL